MAGHRLGALEGGPPPPLPPHPCPPPPAPPGGCQPLPIRPGEARTTLALNATGTRPSPPPRSAAQSRPCRARQGGFGWGGRGAGRGALGRGRPRQRLHLWTRPKGLGFEGPLGGRGGGVSAPPRTIQRRRSMAGGQSALEGGGGGGAASHAALGYRAEPCEPQHAVAHATICILIDCGAHWVRRGRRDGGRTADGAPGARATTCGTRAHARARAASILGMDEMGRPCSKRQGAG